MIVYGYVKGSRYTGDGTLQVKVRIPSIHGPYSTKEYRGQHVRNYVQDADLPYYPSLLLPYDPKEGDVVAVSFTSSTSSDFLVLGLTGGSYLSGTILSGGN